MAQKFTLTAYLARRGVKAKALTKREAELLGIPYPLQRGWPRKYGGIEIDEGLLMQLSGHAEVARQAAEAKARRSEGKAQVRKPADVQMPLASAPAPVVASPVQGFVLRQARRYRKGKSAGAAANVIPW
jgi:hypothetical protein